MAKITGFAWAKIEFHFNFLKIIAGFFLLKIKMEIKKKLKIMQIHNYLEIPYLSTKYIREAIVAAPSSNSLLLIWSKVSFSEW